MLGEVEMKTVHRLSVRIGVSQTPFNFISDSVGRHHFYFGNDNQ